VFFVPGNESLIQSRKAPPPFWSYTDDTAMAISIVETLFTRQRIDQDDLIARFVNAFAAEPRRGYGPGVMRLLVDVAHGADWRTAAQQMFDGEGSMGNGGAMRVAPLGAFFADDLDMTAEQARMSAEVTHAHPEGKSGAIAVALAAALAARTTIDSSLASPERLFREVISRLPDGTTRTILLQAASLPAKTRPSEVVDVLGNGSRILAFDTVPFCLWCAFHNLESYVDAMWTCVSAGGDVDTTAAIVGGIVALSAGPDAIPSEWIRAREPFVVSDGASQRGRDSLNERG
jgi:ADP-ribosylglycohydrolase